MPDIQRLGMPVELGLELCAIVSLQHMDTERESLSDLIEEPDRRALVAGIVDLENPDTGAVVDRGELVEAFARPCDRTPELEHGAMWEIEHIRLLPLRTQQAVFCRANGAV